MTGDWLLEFLGRSPSFLKLVDISGKWSFVVVIFALAFNHWNVFSLHNIPFPYLIDALWGYLIFNGLVATSFKFLESRGRLALGKFCPQCGAPLEADFNYRCPKCGVIKFEKEK